MPIQVHHGASIYNGNTGLIQTNATPAILGIDGNKSRTIECWVYPTGWCTEAGVWAMGKANQARSYFSLKQHNSGNWLMAVWDAAVEFQFAPAPLRQWCHIVSTYDGSALRVYMNGVQVASRTGITFLDTWNSNALRIGRRIEASHTNNSFPGYIRDVRVYNRALSANEILMNYNGIISYDGLTGQWLLKENLNNTAGSSQVTSVLFNRWIIQPTPTTPRKNMAVPFTNPSWVYTQVPTRVVTESSLSFTVNDTPFLGATLAIPVKSGVQYTVSIGEVTAANNWEVAIFRGLSSAGANYINGMQLSNNKKSFTADGSYTGFITLKLQSRSSGGGTFTFNNLQVEAGPSNTGYEIHTPIFDTKASARVISNVPRVLATAR